jgi:hypothetical protein
MSNDSIHERGHSMEEEFFRREDEKLVAKLRAAKAIEDARTALSRVSGVTNPKVLEALAALGITVEKLAALSVYPLVEVAWADGEVDAKEREAVLKYAHEHGIAAGSVESALLEEWLARKPAPRFGDAWTQLVHGMREALPAAELATLRTKLLDRARGVAGASGGVLGLGSKVSKAESAVLEKLERAFTR